MHGSRIVRIYKMRWKIECYHCAATQSLGFGNYHGRKLRSLVAHTYLVALAHVLLVFVQACLPSLTEVPIGNIIDSCMCIVCRADTRANQLTVPIDSDFPYRKALRQFQLVRAGWEPISTKELLWREFVQNREGIVKRASKYTPQRMKTSAYNVPWS